MNIIQDITKFAKSIKAEVNDEKNRVTIKKVLAERKVFLSHKKLEYSAKISIDDKQKKINFTEMLKETGFGLSSSVNDDMSAGFGFKAEAYKTGFSGREGSIKEQSSLFGKKYEYDFDYALVRKFIENLAKKYGYAFHYSIF